MILNHRLPEKWHKLAYNKEHDQLVIYLSSDPTDFIRLYKDGNWAERVDTTPDIEINGYKAEFHEDYVKFGCAEIGVEMFTELNTFLHREFLNYGNRQIETVKIGKGEFTVEHIKQIAEYYEKTNTNGKG